MNKWAFRYHFFMKNIIFRHQPSLPQPPEPQPKIAFWSLMRSLCGTPFSHGTRALLSCGTPLRPDADRNLLSCNIPSLPSGRSILLPSSRTTVLLLLFAPQFFHCSFAPQSFPYFASTATTKLPQSSTHLRPKSTAAVTTPFSTLPS